MKTDQWDAVDSESLLEDTAALQPEEGVRIFGEASRGLRGAYLSWLVLAGSRFIAIVYTADYAGYNTLFLWLLAAGGVEYVSGMLCVGLTVARLFKVQVPLFASVTLVTLLAKLDANSPI